MNTKLQALLWEQNAVAGRVAGMWLLTGTCMLAYVSFDPYRKDFFEVVAMYCVATLGTATVLILRNDAVGHLVTSFERRLTRLPLNTFALVAVPLGIRFFYLCVVCGLLGLVAGVLNGEMLSLPILLLPLYLYLIAQAFAWSRRSLVLVNYLVPLLVILSPAIITLDFGGPHDLEAVLQSPWISLSLLFTVAGISFTLCLAGVTLERRDQRIGFGWLIALSERIQERRVRPDIIFRSPMEALLWYERQRVIWLLPVFTGLAFLVLTFLVLTIGATNLNLNVSKFILVPGSRKAFPELSLFAQYLPLIALALGAIPAGLLGFWPKSELNMLRPAESQQLACAKLLVFGESLLVTLGGVGLLSLGGFLMFGRAEIQLLGDSYAAGYANLAEILNSLLIPCVTFTVAAWVLLVGRRVLVYAVIACSVSVPILIYYAEFWGSRNGDVITIHTFVLAVLVAAPCILLIQARWSQSVKPRVIAGSAVLWIGLSLLLVMTAFGFHIERMPNIMTDEAFLTQGYLWCVFFAGLFATTFVAVPMDLVKRRVR